MTTTWRQDLPTDYEMLILVGDVGGTNTNLGLACKTKNSILLLAEVVFESSEVDDFTLVVKKAMNFFHQKHPNLSVQYCCISGAGPVQNNFCQMTNQTWAIDGSEIEKYLEVKTLIINDFTAISYGLPLLNVNDENQILTMNRPDNSNPQGEGTMRAVIGAGTGLGVGFLTQVGQRWIAFPSEGGHMDFAGFDEESEGVKKNIQNTIDIVPEYEFFISGMGIKNIYYWIWDEALLDKEDPVIKEIMSVGDLEKPPLISKYSKAHPVCKRVMRIFVRMYARFAASVCCLLLPRAGLYLAGGIAGKNWEVFTEENLFVNTFEQHCNPNIYKILKKIPIYIVKDYSISLYGAANAALSLMDLQ